MKVWLLGLFSITILSVMVSVLLEKNRLYKTIQGILTLLLATTIATPFFSLQSGNFTFHAEDTLALSSDYESRIQALKTTYLEEQCQKVVSKQGIDSKVTLLIDYKSGGKVVTANVYLKNYGINEKDENIVKIRKNLAEYCNVKEERIYIYVAKN